MAEWTDRLTLLVDAVTKGASSNLKGLQGDLTKTDAVTTKATGGAGKLSAAWGFLKSSGLAAGIGVSTVAATVTKSLKAFEDLAKQSIDMGAALGISTDEASRWIAVADDYVISSDDMTKALLAVEKSAASGGRAIEAAGGQVKRAADGSVNVSSTFESVADGLNSIHDPAAKAAAGAALFGKNWATIAPLMDQGGAAMDRAMKSVSDGQVITDGEAQAAERMRLAQDHLNDSLGDLERALGGVVANFAPLIDAVAGATDWLQNAGHAVSGFLDSTGPMGRVTNDMLTPFKLVTDVLGKFGGKAHDTKKPVDDLTDSVEGAGKAAEDMDAAYKAMSGQLDSQSALLRATSSFDDLRDATAGAHFANVAGTKESIAANRKMQESVIATKQDVIRYAQSLGAIPPEKVTEINALIDQGDYMTAIHKLNELSKDRSARIDINMFANLTVPAGTPGTIRTILPSTGRVTGAAAPAAAELGAAAAGVGMAVPAAAAATSSSFAPTLVVQIHAPSIGNPAHISDAVVAGYNRALRLAGPRAVTVPTSGASWTS